MGKGDLLENNAQFVSVDWIGEKNQVLLELTTRGIQYFVPGGFLRIVV